MKALVKTALGMGNVEIRDVAEPSAGEGQVVLEVAYTGICGTDLHIYLGEYNCAPPMTLGHEVVGTVVELGSGVQGFKIGDRVVPETYFHVCGHCPYCRSGRQNLCPERRSIGTHVNGGFARYLVVPAHRLHRVPDNVPTQSAAMTEPLACCLRALLEMTTINPGDVVLISGPGPIGLLCLQVAKAAGARTVLCGVDGDEERLNTGKRVGADVLVNASQDSLPTILQEMTDGFGPDLCVEAAGAAPSLRQCMELVRRGGTIAQVGLYARPAEIDVNLIPMKELSVIGSFAHVPWAWERGLDLMSRGAIQIDPLVSSVTSILNWRDKFDSLRQKRDCKVLLTPAN